MPRMAAPPTFMWVGLSRSLVNDNWPGCRTGGLCPVDVFLSLRGCDSLGWLRSNGCCVFHLCAHPWDWSSHSAGCVRLDRVARAFYLLSLLCCTPVRQHRRVDGRHNLLGSPHSQAHGGGQSFEVRPGTRRRLAPAGGWAYLARTGTKLPGGALGVSLAAHPRTAWRPCVPQLSLGGGAL